jgi:hypothetical protein
MKLGRLIALAGLAFLISGCGTDPIDAIKNSGFCENSNLSFNDTLSLKYDESIKWKKFESGEGKSYVEVNAKSKSGQTFTMQYQLKKTASGKTVSTPGYIEIDGEKSNMFGLLFLCMG